MSRAFSIWVREEVSAAVGLADEGLLTRVQALVGSKLTGLGEGAIAVGVKAFVGSLARVRSAVSLE